MISTATIYEDAELGVLEEDEVARLDWWRKVGDPK